MTDQNNEPKVAVETTDLEVTETQIVVEATDSNPEPEVETLVSKITVDPKVKGAMPVPAAMVNIPAPNGPAVVSDGLVDDVALAACVYKNLHARKSLTVHHLQRRLEELGYAEAGMDKDGYYGDLTKFAVASYQRDNKLEGDGLVDAETFLAIFKGDPNVNPIV